MFDQGDRDLDEPLEKVCPLDWRLDIAKGIARNRKMSKKETKKFLNKVIKCENFSKKSWFSKGHLAQWHGMRPNWQPCNFSQFARLPQHIHFPVGIKGYIDGSLVPPVLEGSNIMPATPKNSPALFALAAPVRQVASETWVEESAEAVFLHPNSNSSYTIILDQNFRMLNQMLQEGAKEDSTAVSLLFSTKMWIGSSVGPDAPIIKLDWNELWFQVGSLKKIMQKGLMDYEEADCWLNPIPAYFMIAEATYWNTKSNCRNIFGKCKKIYKTNLLGFRKKKFFVDKTI